jgi:DNA-binding LacI/PurR family transcriptional regulator
VATIYDVAQECGFSLGTVSNVINDGPKPVRPETRRLVWEAVQRLNFHPNAVARGLARQRTQTIGILFGVVESSAIVINAYSAAILQAVLSVAAGTGYNVTHLTTPWRGADESLAFFRDGRTDGMLVVAPPTDSDLLPALASLNLPLVAVSGATDQARLPSVDIDDSYGTRLVMDHLLALGHRRIAHISGHPNLVSGHVRQRVFAECLVAADIQLRQEYLRPGQYSPEAGYENARALLKLGEPPTAIFAANDEIAVGVLDAAREMGVSVPQDLSVVGVDNRPMASLVMPSLTTLQQPFGQVGEEATRLLIRRIAGEEVPDGVRLFLPNLVIRESTAPAPVNSTCHRVQLTH